MKWSREDELEYSFDRRVLEMRFMDRGISFVIHMFYFMMIMCVFAIPIDVLFALVLLFQFFFAFLKAQKLFSSTRMDSKSHLMEKNLYFPVTRANIVHSKIRIMLNHLLMECGISVICVVTSVINSQKGYDYKKILVVYGAVLLGVVVGFLNPYLMHRKELKQ